MKITTTCSECGKSYIADGYTMRVFKHILLAICTVGFWLPVWLFISWKQHLRASCFKCGKERAFIDE